MSDMSVEGSIADQEPGKEFNPAECIRHTVSTFEPIPLSLGGGIEKRYLDDDVYVRPGERFERLHSLDSAVNQRINQFGDPGVELTQERLREFYNQEKQARKSWGSRIISRAGELKLVKILTPEQAKTFLGFTDHDLARFAVGHVSPEFNEWEILPTEDNNKPILLVPAKSEEGQLSFETVHLDDLNDRDPGFLPQQIRDYQEKFAMSVLVPSVIYNLNLHQVRETELLPKFMRELAQIVDPEQRAKETESIKFFLNCMMRLGPEYASTTLSFQQRLSDTVRSMRGSGNANIQTYLRHIAECPTQATEANQRSSELANFYNTLLSVKYSAALSDSQKKDSVTKVLREPDMYTFYLDKAEKRDRTDRDQHQKFIDFIAKTRDVTDQTRFMEVLKQELPEFHATLVRFQEWLGIDYYSEKDRFDELTSWISGFGSNMFNLEQLNKEIRRQLRSVISVSKGEFEGIHLDSWHNEVILSNPHLELVLPLIVIKAKQSEAEKKIEKDDYSKRIFSRCQGLTQELRESYEERVKQADNTLLNIARDKLSVASLKEQTGITDEEIAHLIELTSYEDRNSDFDPGIYFQLYNCLFNALVLEKQGKINMHSPVFKAFLKSLFPRTPDTVWQNL